MLTERAWFNSLVHLVQFSPLAIWVMEGVCVCVCGGGGMKDDAAEILFQSFLQEATVSSSGMGRGVLSLA